MDKLTDFMKTNPKVVTIFALVVAGALDKWLGTGITAQVIQILMTP